MFIAIPSKVVFAAFGNAFLFRGYSPSPTYSLNISTWYISLKFPFFIIEYISNNCNNIVFLLNYQTKGGSTTLQTFGCYDEIYIDFIQILRKY